ncbi:MAG: YsnF/AvaK domain-containing protein [Microlunatus sp.]|nr:YsnF/AvaK domain-containing protein [Microlunatus sp.]MDN5770967.1 YsnF/AvaK domain-containing protein [Microlunatus sp.]
MVRSEEQLEVSRAVRVSGGLRLHKYVVTETITQTVEVRREKLRVTELSAEELTMQSESSAGPDGYEFRDRDFEVMLHEERVVVTKEVVPVERVRVRTRVVTKQTQVSDTIRREQVELDTARSGRECDRTESTGLTGSS